jgi:pimeloyl-ACP methyl ester carboxylesterase
MTVFYRQRRGDGPPLLLLHATLSNSRQTRALANGLAERFTVLSIDRRGSGKNVTQDPAAPIEVATHVEDLAEVMAVESVGPAVVVGHSYGGCVALELAARRPELVRGVFAYEPPYGQVASREVREGIAEIGRRTLAARDRGDLGSAALAFLEGVAGADAVAALGPAARARVERAGQGAVADATLLGMDPDGLTGIGCPVRIATGDASAPLYAEIAEALAARIPDASHVRLSGLDHMAPVLRPDTIAAAIFEFLDA